MLELLTVYLLRGNSLVNILILTVVGIILKLYVFDPHELAKIELQNQHEVKLTETKYEHMRALKKIDNQANVELKRLDNKRHYEKLKAELEYKLNLSQSERNFDMVNNVIIKICQDHTQPRQEVRKGWLKTEETWKYPEQGMEHCVKFMTKYVTLLNRSGRQDEIEEDEKIDEEL